MLRALAVLMMADDDFCRDRFVDADALPLLVASLGAPSVLDTSSCSIVKCIKLRALS